MRSLAYWQGHSACGTVWQRFVLGTWGACTLAVCCRAQVDPSDGQKVAHGQASDLIEWLWLGAGRSATVDVA